LVTALSGSKGVLVMMMMMHLLLQKLQMAGGTSQPLLF
jgi:hypothetical protein